MRINTVHAVREDLDEVAPLFDAYRVFYRQLSDLQGACDFLGERLVKSDSKIILARESETKEVAGFVQLYPSFTSTGMARIWILNDLFVSPKFRRQGVGARLMQAAREFAMENGGVRIILTTEKTNATAKALYESMGWVLDDVFDHYTLTL